MKNKDILFKKNRHYCFPFPFPWIKLGKIIKMRRVIKFDDSIKYKLPEEDQNDVNKLFGCSCGFHQVNSDRIGFRYNIQKDKVELVLYSYIDETRIPTRSICFVDINEEVVVELIINLENKETRSVKATVKRSNGDIYETGFNNKKCSWSWLKYTLGGYFGGNQTAPHNIKVWQKEY